MNQSIIPINNHLELYLRSLDTWACGKYSVAIGFMALKNGESYDLLGAFISLNPTPLLGDTFIVETVGLVAGYQTFNNLTKSRLLKIIKNASIGKLEIGTLNLMLDQKGSLSYFTDLIDTTKWFSELQLKIHSGNIDSIDTVRMTDITNELRCASPCFDGLEDLARYVGLHDSYHSTRSITIRANPPIDIITNECSFKSNLLTIVVRSITPFPLHQVSLSLRTSQGNTQNRLQIAEKIKWGRSKDGLRTGVISMQIEDSDAVLLMLMLGNTMIRRQWFEDPSRTTNFRLVANHAFDKDLKLLNKYLHAEPNESRKFESAIVELLYILGFTAMQPLDTDAPDIIACTPLGKLLVIECTLKISDIHLKIGKLVNRRGKLVDTLKEGGHPFTSVTAVLVCGENRDKIPGIDDNSWQENQILLITKSDIEDIMHRLRYATNPDQLLDEALNSSTVQKSLFNVSQ